MSPLCFTPTRRPTSLLSALLCASPLLSSALLYAQPSDEAALLEAPRPDYLGVRPGLTNFAPGKRPKPKPGQQVITWVGFQARGDRAKVFVQTNGTPIYEVANSDPSQVVLDFPSATLHTRNDARELDTAFFPTVVRRVRQRQVGRQLVRVMITLREPARYRIKKENNFLHLYFDPPKEPIDVIAERERELEQMKPSEGDVVELKRRRPEANLPSEGEAESGEGASTP